MIVHIHKGLPIGEFKAPASKSYSHRYLIAAGLAKDSGVSNLIFSKDILASLSCLEALDCSYIKKERSVFFENKDSHCCLDISLFVLQMLLCVLHKNDGVYLLYK